MLSNLSSGIYAVDQERLTVEVNSNVSLEDVVARYPGVVIEDPERGVLRTSLGQATLFVSQFLKDPDVSHASVIQTKPTFYTSLYLTALKNQAGLYLHGDFGGIQYQSNPGHPFPITEQLWPLLSRTLSYLIPALIVSLILGVALATLTMIKPTLGKIFDGVHIVLQGMPDFLVVFLLQFLAIFIAVSAERKVFLIMQFNDEIPFLIPFLAITVLPAALVYGTLRIALQREWSEAYIKTAFMKGLSQKAVVIAHVLRNTQEDLLAIFPRVVSTAIASMVIAEVMTGIVGLGGYSLSRSVQLATSLPFTCAILASFAVLAHLFVAVIRRRFVVRTKEGA